MTLVTRLRAGLGRRTLREHLTVLTGATVAIVVAIASCVVFVVTRNQLRDHLDETLRGLARQAEPQVDPFAGQFAISLDTGRLSGERGIAQWVRATGELPVVPAPAVPGSMPGSEIELIAPVPFLPISDRARGVAAGEEPAYLQDVEVGDVEMRVLTTQVVPGLAIQVAQPLDQVNSVLSQLLWVLLAVVVGGTAAAVAAGRAIGRSAVRRVGDLTRVAEDVTTTGDFARRMPVEGNDELSRLATTFNSMLTTLEASLSSQRRLVADASHELRTPLTSIRTNIEVLARAQELPDHERKQIISDVTIQIEELSLLIADLVELSRGSDAFRQIEDVDLAEVSAAAMDRARRFDPTLEFAASMDRSIVRGDPHRIERAISNLIDNATKWNREGEPIEVMVREGSVIVRDHGPGFADDDLPQVFERFYRAPNARGKPGSGLGLAIVKDVAIAHGGSVAAANADDGGAVVTLGLPVRSLS